MVTVAVTVRLDEALLLRSVLEGCGIACFIPDEMTAQTQWGVIAAGGGIRVQVDERDEPAARRALAAPASDGA
jgi:Putative prokaryotic signal transducing protein